MIQIYGGLLLIFHIACGVVYISTAYSGSSFHNHEIAAHGDDRATFIIDLMRNIQSANDTEEVFSIAENVLQFYLYSHIP